jgi:hypothetical protein
VNARIHQLTWKIVERGSKAKMPSAFVELTAYCRRREYAVNRRVTREDSDIPAVAIRRDLARVLFVARALRARCGA